MSRTPLPNYTRSTPGQTDLFMILSTFVIANTTKIDHDSGKSNQKLVTYSSFRVLPFKNRWVIVSQSRKPAELGGCQAIWQREESKLREALAYRPLPLDHKANTSIKTFAYLPRDSSKHQQWFNTMQILGALTENIWESVVKSVMKPEYSSRIWRNC